MSTSKIRLHVRPFSLLENQIIPKVYYKKVRSTLIGRRSACPIIKDRKEIKCDNETIIKGRNIIWNS